MCFLPVARLKRLQRLLELMCCRETFQLEGCKIFSFDLIYLMIVRLGALWGRCKSFVVPLNRKKEKVSVLLLVL